ncbi:MAG: MraY family glycosyltransferase [Patescibacteria group bacterium]|jgi:UDP-GlcNAc:undecaprenyl-phosphate GlcNAc-1-phosphate transferase
MTFYLAPFFLATIFALFFTPLIRIIAQTNKIVDSPAPRKIHSKPIPLLGGLAVFLAFTVTTVIFWYFGYISDAKITNLHILAILAAGLILMIGGFLDDKYSLKPSRQFIFPLMAIILVIAAGVRIQFITNPLGGVLKFPVELGLFLTFFWLLGMVYTTKFLDGLDGLAAGVTAIGSLIIFIVSLSWDVAGSGTSVLALILAGSCLGFLAFNWHPAKIFLGEGGSVFCGFMLGILAIISGSKIATALLIMGIPILDVIWVIGRRIWQGSSPTKPDAKHLHFRLLDIGLTQRQAVVFLYFLTTAFGITSLFLQSKGKVIALLLLTLFMIALAIGLVLVYRFKDKTNKIKMIFLLLAIILILIIIILTIFFSGAA